MRAARLKERVYITFTALAVVLALRSHHATAEHAGYTLLIAAAGTLLAVFVADVVSHIAVHAVLPTRTELRGMLHVIRGGFGALVVPFVLIGLAAAGAWPIDRALRVSTTVLLVSLIVIGYLAVRRVRLPIQQKLIVLFAEFVLGAAVVGLELLAH